MLATECRHGCPAWRTRDEEYVPEEADDGGGEDAPGGAVGEGVEGAEGQTHLPLPGRDGVADVDGGDGLDDERDEDVGETEVGQEQVVGGGLEPVDVADGGDDEEVGDDAGDGQTHLQQNQQDALAGRVGGHGEDLEQRCQD